MRSIILAAGEGTRLRPYTADRPKCLVEIGGKPLLLHQVEALRAAGIHDIHIVTGYRSEQIEALGLPTHRNQRYAETNMVASLMSAADLLDGSDDVVISYADIIFEARVVAAVKNCNERLSTAIDRCWLELWRLRVDDPLEDAETLRMDEQGWITELGKRPESYDDIEGQYMGLTKVRADVAPTVVLAYAALDPARLYDGSKAEKMHMTSFLQLLIGQGIPMKAVVGCGAWLEVDTVSDLETFNQMYTEGSLKRYCDLHSSSGDSRPWG